MSNPLYQQFNRNPMMNMMKDFEQFRKTFNGNPQQMVQQMLNSGQISQQQYAEAVEMAKQFMNMMK